MKKKILVIDDDTNIVDYLVTLLEDNGYVTFSAGDAREGFEVAQKEMPDLITLDLEMPGEWGHACTTKCPRIKISKTFRLSL